MDSTARLKRFLSKNCYDKEFISAAKADLPTILGRLSLLEEWYGCSTYYGDPGRAESIRVQLGDPSYRRPGLLKRVLMAITGR